MKIKDFKTIPGFEDYKINKNGDVLSFKNNDMKIIKTFLAGAGYRYICLCKNGKRKSFTIHKLVYTTFKGNLPEGHEIDHVDSNKLNNNLENLEAVTSKENIIRAFSQRLRKTCGPNNMKTLTKEEVAAIRFFHSSKKGITKNLSIIFGRTKKTIKNVAEKRTYSYE